MNLKQALTELEARGNEKVRERNQRVYGVGDNQYGVPAGEIRKVAKLARGDAGLTHELWATGNIDAQMLSILLLKPKDLSVAEVEAMVRATTCEPVAQWLNAYVVHKHPQGESVREAWMSDDHPWVARAGWSLTHERITKQPDGLDFGQVLDRLEAELPTAPPEAQWTMNFCLAAIGIASPDHRDRAIALGEKFGLYRDYPVSKGCVSPYAPTWIREMVSRQGSS